VEGIERFRARDGGVKYGVWLIGRSGGTKSEWGDEGGRDGARGNATPPPERIPP